jgi:hypothetical protein
MSYYGLLNIIKTELEATQLVNTITEGDIFRVDLSKQTIFPLSHIMVNNATFENNVIRYNVSIIAMDVVDISKDETTNIFIGNDNEQDVLNTQITILNRVYDKLIRGDYFTNSGIIDGNPTCEPFIERFENNLAGWTMTFDYLIGNEMTICDISPTVSVYSQVVEFNDGFMNSIVYRCDGEAVAYSYGQNQPNLIDLIAMFNQDPPVQESATFLEYGICYDNGDGRVRMEMTQEAYNALSCGGTLTLDVIYD